MRRGTAENIFHAIGRSEVHSATGRGKGGRERIDEGAEWKGDRVPLVPAK